MRWAEAVVRPLRFAARQFAGGFDYDFGVVTLYVMAAIVHADMICGWEVGRDLILEACG